MAGELAGRTAVVIGTSPNIGAGIGLSLAAAGASVACVDADGWTANKAAAEIRDRGGIAVGLACDVSDQFSAEDAFGSVTAKLGLPDVLVNGAVKYNTKGVLAMPLDEWRSQLTVMLDSTFVCTKLFAQALVEAERPGSVINLLSTAAHQGEPGNIGYGTAKGGLLNFTRSAAVELARFGIRVNSVTPTSTDPAEWQERTVRWGSREPDPGVLAQLEVAAPQVPLGRLPRPSDYGAAVVFLASAAADMITGIDLPVDAGSLARYWRRMPESE